MNCPVCGNQPISYFRYNFSLRRGVGLARALTGHIRCEHCQTVLHAGTFGRSFWRLVIPAFALIVLFGVFLDRISSSIGTGAAVSLFILILLATGMGANLLGWRHIRYEKADINSDSRASV